MRSLFVLSFSDSGKVPHPFLISSRTDYFTETLQPRSQWPQQQGRCHVSQVSASLRWSPGFCSCQTFLNCSCFKSPFSIVVAKFLLRLTLLQDHFDFSYEQTDRFRRCWGCGCCTFTSQMWLTDHSNANVSVVVFVIHGQCDSNRQT